LIALNRVIGKVLPERVVEGIRQRRRSDRREVEALRLEIDNLKEEIDELRTDNRRVAELLDVVERMVLETRS
jgi:hypothetical protein